MLRRKKRKEHLENIYSEFFKLTLVCDIDQIFDITARECSVCQNGHRAIEVAGAAESKIDLTCLQRHSRQVLPPN